MTNCKKLAFMQDALRKQLKDGTVPIYKHSAADTTEEVKKLWNNVLRNGARGV